MLEKGLFEEGIRRVGAEQEMFLVDGDLRPAPVAVELLEGAEDPRLTNELARFNLEANIEPRIFTGDCLRRMESDLREVVEIAREGARRQDAEVVLTGILPTLAKSDLSLDNMTPSPRYRALNDALRAARGGDFTIDIKGTDDLHAVHDNVMYEACNTSFQIHFQLGPKEFARLYNIAQLVTPPVLAAAVNSPLFLGARLWQETRVALFGYAIDDRSNLRQSRGYRPRVIFGDDWVRESVLEIFREQIARFRVVLRTHTDPRDPVEMAKRGEAPSLRALRLHNGTVYRWNRVCYGVTSEGRPTLRIENRVLPAGPTILDEVANAAFFFGLMAGLGDTLENPADHIAFADVRSNFYRAARHGLAAQFEWLDGEHVTAKDLIRNTLLPVARTGLQRAEIPPEDIDRYLGVIEERVESGRTGARWALDSLASMGKRGTGDIRRRRLAAAMLEHQGGEPVHRWPLVEPAVDEVDLRRGYRHVGQFMTTDLFTVRQDDLVDLAASVMHWEHIKHVPVEDDEGRLVGLVTHRSLLRLVAEGGGTNESVVSDIMVKSPLTVKPETRTLDALRQMRNRQVSCLPVVDDVGHLVGILTEADLIEVSTVLLERFLATLD
jgi:CBS domain-containing protein